jgi:dihydrodipicolinate synthase/N-acetylneuraminate lyase
VPDQKGESSVKTSAVSAADLARSVIAVPPLARSGDLTLNPEANVSLIRHLEDGGVSTMLYGGNANFYNMGMYEYGAVLDFLEQTVAAGTWLIPSAGPDFGKLMDQARVLRTRAFPTAMVLPLTFPATPDGSEKAIRLFAESYGRPVIVYVKAESFLTPTHIKRLVDTGLVAAIKYAVVREDAAVDPFLRDLLDKVDAKLIVSGIGERPAVEHLRTFGLAGFTSGSVCIAPRGSTLMLAALKSRDFAKAEAIRAAYLPLEDLRDAHSPIRVLHEAVTLAGIADMGPMLPQLSAIAVEERAAVGAAAKALLAHDRALQ